MDSVQAQNTELTRWSLTESCKLFETLELSDRPQTPERCMLAWMLQVCHEELNAKVKNQQMLYNRSEGVYVCSGLRVNEGGSNVKQQ